MDGASFSDIGFPIEILRELVLQDPSPSSLARWCRVGSHDLLALAGPMLYRVVALTRAQDVVPMLLRLRLVRSPSFDPDAPGSTRLAYLRGIQRLEIHVLPPPDALLALSGTRPALVETDMELAVVRADKDELAMSSFFVPRLLAEVQPAIYHLDCTTTSQLAVVSFVSSHIGVYLAAINNLGPLPTSPITARLGTPSLATDLHSLYLAVKKAAAGRLTWWACWRPQIKSGPTSIPIDQTSTGPWPRKAEDFIKEVDAYLPKQGRSITFWHSMAEMTTWMNAMLIQSNAYTNAARVYQIQKSEQERQSDADALFARLQARRDYVKSRPVMRASRGPPASPLLPSTSDAWPLAAFASDSPPSIWDQQKRGLFRSDDDTNAGL